MSILERSRIRRKWNKKIDLYQHNWPHSTPWQKTTQLKIWQKIRKWDLCVKPLTAHIYLRNQITVDIVSQRSRVGSMSMNNNNNEMLQGVKWCRSGPLWTTSGQKTKDVITKTKLSILKWIIIRGRSRRICATLV